jgi:hypothetical protein
VRQHKKSWGVQRVKSLCRNRDFLADALRRFALVIPYGCWGTIIPKYIIDQYHSNEKVWIVYLTSLCTTIVGAHFLAVHVAGWLYRRGFKWEWWSMVSVLLYCAGLMLLIFAGHPVLLPIAIVVFICGEVFMTPCFDETAKKHSGEKEMATCMGLLHLVDGGGRMIGAAFSLALYGWMRSSDYSRFYWPVTVSVFLAVCSALHLMAFAIARRDTPAGHPRAIAPSPPEVAEAVVLAEESLTS